MEQEMKKPFKTVTTEYFEELDTENPVISGTVDRRIRVVTTTNQWVGSDKDPVTSVTFEYLQKEKTMNIGDEVVQNGDYGEVLFGKLTAIGSDKDSYDDIKLEDGVFMYKSKKLKKYVEFKEKSLQSVYIEITRSGTRGMDNLDYILPNELIGAV